MVSTIGIQGVIDSQVQNSSIAGTPTTKTLGKDDFLKLLVAQLQNQNPMEQTDDKQFIAQLAQFSSVEQLQGLQSEMQNLVSVMEAMSLREQLTSGSTFIGKQVTGLLPATGETVSGIVTGVRLDSGSAILEPLGIPIENVTTIKKGDE